MEIERKFLVVQPPADLAKYPNSEIRQGYISRDPVIRIRKRDDRYTLTVKGHGLMEREELELPLDAAAFAHLEAKCEGTVIEKTRYLIPLGTHTVELDLFHSGRPGLLMAEVEFESPKAAAAFRPPAWFGREVTEDPAYQNANM